MLKLNMGAGTQKMPGWKSVDFFVKEADYHVDLRTFPWPWADGEVDSVAMFHFLEHVDELERTVCEVHRILRPGGMFWVIVPHARNPAAFDISHRYYFTCTTFHNLSHQCDYRFDGRRLFQQESLKMPLVMWKWIRWTPLDWVTSRWPFAYEKVMPIAPAWIEWVGRKVAT